MKNILENDELLVQVDDHGAELCRVFDKKENAERIHPGDETFWKRSAPVLFPFVGACMNGTYRFDGREYKMGQHGFARDSELELVRKEEGRLVHRLVSAPGTLEKYPFAFELRIIHELKGRRLNIRWEVVNTGDETMYFQIGAHPAFLIGEGKTLSDVSIDLGSEGEHVYYRIEDPGSGCCFEDEPRRLPAGRIFQLNGDSFSEGVYIFEKGTMEKASLLVNGREKVRIVFPGFEYFGIWAPKGASPFVCLEPWHGRTDAFGFDGDLRDRCCEQSLGAGAEFASEYHIEFL